MVYDDDDITNLYEYTSSIRVDPEIPVVKPEDQKLTYEYVMRVRTDEFNVLKVSMPLRTTGGAINLS